MHAKSRLAVLATILVAIFMIGCNRDVTVNNWITGPGGTDTTLACVVDTTLSVSIAGATSGSTVNPYPVGQVDTMSVVEVSTPSGCRTPSAWNFVSSNPAVVSVTSLGGTSVRIQSVGAGSATVSVRAVGDTTRRFYVNFVVPSPTGSVSSIDYTPRSIAVAVGDSVLLTATCVQGTDVTEACNPFWHSTDPTTFLKEGLDTLVSAPEQPPVNIVRGTGTNGTGMTAWAKRLRAGSTTVCVQWTRVRTTPSRCYTWP